MAALKIRRDDEVIVISGKDRGKTGKVLIQKLAQIRAQLIQIEAARLQNGRCVGIIGQPQKQVLQSRVLVTAFARQGQSSVKRLLQVA